MSFVNALPLRHMLQYRRGLDQQMWCSPWYLFNSILKPLSHEILSEWCPPNYVWTNLMVVSYQNETLCICFILEESPKVTLVIDITEPLADVRSWDGEWLYYIVWPDHAVILGHFLARPLSHCLEGKNQWQLTFGHFIWLSPQKYKQCWLRCSSWSIWALFNLETFLGEMTTTWYFSYKKAEKIDNAN